MAAGSQQSATALCKAAKLPNTFGEIVAMAGQIRPAIAGLDNAAGRQQFQDKLIESCRIRYPDLVNGDVEALIAKFTPGMGRLK